MTELPSLDLAGIFLLDPAKGQMLRWHNFALITIHGRPGRVSDKLVYTLYFQSLCQDRPSFCEFYTFDGANCWLFLDCPSQNTAACPQCKSSQIGCFSQGPTEPTLGTTTGPTTESSTEESPTAPPEEGDSFSRNQEGLRIYGGGLLILIFLFQIALTAGS